MGVKDWTRVGGFKIVAVLDIGSVKTACLIAAIGPWSRQNSDAADRVRIVGMAQHRSYGVTAGVITDLHKAEQSARATIAKAESMAGVTLDDIVVSVSCGQLSSQNFSATADIASGVVADSDLERLYQAARSYATRKGRSIIQLHNRSYRLDGSEQIADPRGMAAQRVTADWHAVTGDDAPLQNLLLVIERCYLGASHMFAAPYASGLATTTEEERKLGVMCIDLGGGTTTLSVFMGGEFMFTDSIGIGAHHITFDIARALQTPLAEAERIKALYGSVVSAQSDAHESFSYPLAGEEEGDLNQTSKAHLSAIIRQRFCEIVARIENRVSEAGIAPQFGDRIVITGGGSQLVGASDVISHRFGKRVRIGTPVSISGLPEVAATPAFATAVGLLEANDRCMREETVRRTHRARMYGSYINRVGDWLRQSF